MKNSTAQPPEVADLARRLADVEAQLAAAGRARRRWLLGTAFVLVVSASVAFAADGQCPNGLPFCFASDTPARASEINHNFAQLKEWLETKVGAVSSGTITATSITTTGITATTLSVSGNSTLNTQTVNGAATFASATVNGNLTLGATGTAVFKAMSWCDCEFASQVTTRGGSVVTASVPDLFLYENGQAGIFECRDGRFLVGIEKTSAGCLTSVGCLEQYKCCRPCNLKAQ